MKKRTVLSVLAMNTLLSKASFSLFSAVFQNIPQKRDKLSLFKTGKRENKLDVFALKMDHIQSPNLPKNNNLLKLMIFSFPWSVAYEGWQAMKLTKKACN